MKAGNRLVITPEELTRLIFLRGEDLTPVSLAQYLFIYLFSAICTSCIGVVINVISALIVFCFDVFSVTDSLHPPTVPHGYPGQHICSQLV